MEYSRKKYVLCTNIDLFLPKKNKNVSLIVREILSFLS